MFGREAAGMWAQAGNLRLMKQTSGTVKGHVLD